MKAFTDVPPDDVVKVLAIFLFLLIVSGWMTSRDEKVP